ncbi:MAG: ABC transporter permease, partial [Anaerolineae bacterium]|nr:ABC transporter permease [Anaerolineae bacterium]
MLDEIFTASVFAATIRLATPYIFAAIGEMYAQRSGLLNLGVDGIMLVGSFAGFYRVFQGGSLLEGVIAAMIVGALMGLAMAFISVTLKAEQGISGIGLYLFGLGLSELLFQTLLGTPRTVSGFPDIYIQGLSDIEFLGIGQIFFQHNLLVYVAFALVPISAFILNKTPFGLNI